MPRLVMRRKPRAAASHELRRVRSPSAATNPKPEPSSPHESTPRKRLFERETMEGTNAAPAAAPEDHPLSREARIVNAICKVNTELYKTAKALHSAELWMRTAFEHFQRATEAMKQVSESI